MESTYSEELEHIENLQHQLKRLSGNKQFDEARSLAAQNLQEAENLFGKNHPYLTPYLDMLAEIYERQGLNSRSEAIYKQVLKIWETTFVPDYGIKNLLSDIFHPQDQPRREQTPYNPGHYSVRLTQDLHLGTGDNRKCYAFPDTPGKCIKIDKPWNEGFHNNPKKRIKKTLMPWMADFSSNREETRFYRITARKLGETFYEHAPRCYGIVLTNLGPGLVFARIKDFDGNYSERLDKFLEKHPEKANHVMELIEKVYDHMLKLDLFLFTSNTDNFVIQHREKSGDRLVIIDWKTVGRTNNELPLAQISPHIAKHKLSKELKELKKRVKAYKKTRAKGKSRESF